jgi:hypothetical protein
MQHIIGISRQQISFSSLEDTIAPDNQVRFNDAFINRIQNSQRRLSNRTESYFRHNHYFKTPQTKRLSIIDRSLHRT